MVSSVDKSLIAGTECLDHISWFENLRRGLSAIFIHPFLPLAETGFNYKCLFSRKPYCCTNSINHRHEGGAKSIESKSAHYYDYFLNYSSGLLERLGFAPSSHVKSTTNLSNGKQANSIDSISLNGNLTDYLKRTPVLVILISQLVLCTILLSLFLVKDLKRLALRLNL